LLGNHCSQPALPGAAFETDKERAFKAGAQGYLVKPVIPNDLVGEVSRLLNQ